METLIPLLILVIAILGVMVFFLSRPLTEEQVPELAQKRRNKKILLHFSPSPFSYSPAQDFKSGLKPDGKLYQVDLDTEQVPSFVANLLKYKKHEWSVMVFLRDQKAEHLWANKGPDRSQVHVVSINSILNTAKRNRCDAIMAFHNHPAHDPQRYSYRNPSDLDLEASEKFSQILNTANISYIDHVCERGTAHRYCLNPSPTLYPLTPILEEVRAENSQGRMTHIKLHFELYL
jgi:hypothetical protein